MTYLISFSADYVGNRYVPTTRIYFANIVSEDYSPKCGEYFTDEKPVITDPNERLIDFTKKHSDPDFDPCSCYIALA